MCGLKEFLINAYTAGYYGVPAVFSGDEELCAFAREFIPDRGRADWSGAGGGVISIHPDGWNASGREPRRRRYRGAKCKVPMPERFDS